MPDEKANETNAGEDLQVPWGRLLNIVAVCVAALPVLYFLSFGPAVHLAAKGTLSYLFIDIFYRPFFDLYEHAPASRPVIEWYMGLWI